MRHSTRPSIAGSCRLRVEDFERIAIADAQRDLPYQFAPEPRDLDHLSLMQKAAAIGMTEDHVKRTIVARLLEHAQDKPQSAEYAALVEMGLCEKPDGKRWHQLTYEGRVSAARLSTKLCREFGIHLMREGAAGRYDVNFHCCCGWSTSVRKGSFTQSNAQGRFSQHVITSKATGELIEAMKPRLIADGAP